MLTVTTFCFRGLWLSCCRDGVPQRLIHLRCFGNKRGFIYNSQSSIERSPLTSNEAIKQDSRSPALARWFRNLRN